MGLRESPGKQDRARGRLGTSRRLKSDRELAEPIGPGKQRKLVEGSPTLVHGEDSGRDRSFADRPELVSLARGRGWQSPRDEETGAGFGVPQ
jgi:hypothetical protein